MVRPGQFARATIGEMHMTETSESALRRHPRPAMLAILAVALAGAIVGVIVTNAFAFGGFGPSDRFHRGMLFGGDPAEVDKRVEKAVKHFAVEVEASDAQEARLIAIAKDLVREVRPMRDELRDARRQAVELLAAGTIDRAAVEQLRKAQIERVDAMSARAVAALTEAAEVLSPAQRKVLAERIERFQDRMDRRRGG
jgi:Spy/CpxP family protein refolding chaperone